MPRFKAPPGKYLVSFKNDFKIQEAPTKPPVEYKKKELKEKLDKVIDELSDLQRILYAHDKYAVLLVFQAMDAAGKDSTIRAVMSGINPAGCQVYSFKKPSENELDQDFLWRTNRCLPQRGRIGIFNRSYYEEVLVVRVHPEILRHQKLPFYNEKKIWGRRLESILNLEKHLARNGTIVLKFWLNVSKEEQKNRFLDRLTRPEKHWKFAESDVKERAHWQHYMSAYEEALNATSKPYAPWYAIPADNKPFMRFEVASIIVKALKSLDMHYPKVSKEQKAHFAEMKRMLENE